MPRPPQKTRCMHCGAHPEHQDPEWVNELQRNFALIDLRHGRYMIEGDSFGLVVKTRNGYVFSLDDDEAMRVAGILVRKNDKGHIIGYTRGSFHVDTTEG